MHKNNHRARDFLTLQSTLFLWCAISSMLLAVGSAARAQQPFFMGLGTLPSHEFSGADGVSADGSVVLGGGMFRWTQQMGIVDTNPPSLLDTPVLSRSGTSIFAYHDPDNATWRWTAETGWAPLPNIDSSRFLFRKLPPAGEPNFKHGVSADGRQVVGDYCNLTTVTCLGARWTETGGVQNVFDMIPFGGISAEGSVVIGKTPLASGTLRARRWTAATGVTSLGLDSYPSSQATSVSADGAIIVGQIGLKETCCPDVADSVFVWTEQLGPLVLPNPTGATGVFAPIISDNGSTLVAGFFFGGERHAFRWTGDSGWEDLGFNSFDGSVSSDGSIIVGTDNTEVVIWDEIQGARRLRDELADLGLAASLIGWGALSSSAGVSADGRTIVGTGINPQGKSEAWIAYLGPSEAALSGDFNSDGSVEAADYVVWRKGFATGTYTQSDYNTWRANFGATATGAAPVAHSGTNIPEPSALILAALAIATFAWRWRAIQLMANCLKSEI